MHDDVQLGNTLGNWLVGELRGMQMSGNKVRYRVMDMVMYD